MKNILLIEDNAGDIKLFEEAISLESLDVNLTVLEDGLEGMEYFEKLKDASASEYPSLIISDLNLPKISGKELIKAFKSDPKLKVIPIIVLSTSSLDKDIKDCYELNANAFLEKPLDIEDFFYLIKLIDSFWLRNCHLSKI